MKNYAGSGQESVVVLESCHGYDRDAICALTDGTMKTLGLPQSFHGRTVLLKPNLISYSGPQHSCTNAEFVAGVACWFHEHGARLLIGDSPAFGSGARVMAGHGIDKAVAPFNVTVAPFRNPRRMTLDCGVEVPVAEDVLDCDLFVGLPKIKAHNQLYVTMAVKNIFGTVLGVNKAMLHMIHGSSPRKFAEILLDLVNLLPEQVHIADGIEVMHRSGPLDGDLLAVHCLAAARQPLALDTAMMDALEVDPSCCPIWSLAASRGEAVTLAENIQFPHLRPEYFHGSGFEPPVDMAPIRFSAVRFFRGMARRLLIRLGHHQAVQK